MSNNTENTDFTAIIQGDAKAFEHLFMKYHIPLCEYVRSFVGEKETAEDLVEDALVWFWKNRKTISRQAVNVFTPSITLTQIDSIVSLIEIKSTLLSPKLLYLKFIL